MYFLKEIYTEKFFSKKRNFIHKKQTRPYQNTRRIECEDCTCSEWPTETGCQPLPQTTLDTPTINSIKRSIIDVSTRIYRRGKEVWINDRQIWDRECTDKKRTRETSTGERERVDKTFGQVMNSRSEKKKRGPKIALCRQVLTLHRQKCRKKRALIRMTPYVFFGRFIFDKRTEKK